MTKTCKIEIKLMDLFSDCEFRSRRICVSILLSRNVTCPAVDCANLLSHDEHLKPLSVDLRVLGVDCPCRSDHLSLFRTDFWSLWLY